MYFELCTPAALPLHRKYHKLFGCLLKVCPFCIFVLHTGTTSLLFPFLGLTFSSCNWRVYTSKMLQHMHRNILLFSAKKICHGKINKASSVPPTSGLINKKEHLKGWRPGPKTTLCCRWCYQLVIHTNGITAIVHVASLELLPFNHSAWYPHVWVEQEWQHWKLEKTSCNAKMDEQNSTTSLLRTT